MNDLDDLLTRAFANRPAADVHPSMPDVHRRVRRHRRRRHAGLVGAAALVGVGLTAVTLNARHDTQPLAAAPPSVPAPPPVPAAPPTAQVHLDPATVWAAIDAALANDPAAAGIGLAADVDRTVMPSGASFAGGDGELDGTAVYFLWWAIAHSLHTSTEAIAAANPAVDLTVAPVDGTELTVPDLMMCTSMAVVPPGEAAPSVGTAPVPERGVSVNTVIEAGPVTAVDGTDAGSSGAPAVTTCSLNGGASGTGVACAGSVGAPPPAITLPSTPVGADGAATIVTACTASGEPAPAPETSTTSVG